MPVDPATSRLFPRRLMPARKPPIIVGIDLAGSPRRPTGVCILRGLGAQRLVAFGGEEGLLVPATGEG